MSNYVKSTNFTSKDTLPSGDALKKVKGTELDVEFNNIASAISSKADLVSPTFTGTPFAPTAAAGTNTTQIATTAFVTAAVSATQSSANITGGTITGITDLAIADGGTGASTASGARTNLDVPSNAEVAAQVSAAVPAGTVIHVAMNTAPSGYLKADGTAVSRTTYATLFAAIGTTFGSGDGSTTFNLPDLRGEFIRGWDDGRGRDSGRVFGSNQDATGIGSRNSANGEVYTTNADYTSTGPTVFAYSIGGGNVGSTYSHTRPRNVALLACIKY